MNYIDKQTGEVVELERWAWEAVYHDGLLLKQFDKIDDEHGEFHRFAEIDQSRLWYFHMVNDAGKKLTLMFRPGTMKLIHKYRNHIQVTEVLGKDGVTTIQNEIRQKAYFFGYEESGKKFIIFIAPNDEVIFTDDPDKVRLG